LEALDGFLVVTVAGGEVVVVVAYFVAEGGNLFDDAFVVFFWEDAEVVTAFDAELVLDLCHAEGAGVAGFDVVAEEDEW